MRSIMKIWHALVTLIVASLGCFTVQGQTAPSEFCSSLTGLEQLKAYVTCQESGKIDSCAGLATVLGHRPTSESDRQRYLDLIERNQVPIITALARKLHHVWRDRKKLKEPLYRLIELNREIEKMREALYPEEGSALGKLKSQAAALARAIAIQNTKLPKIPAVYEPALRYTDAGLYDIANSDYDNLPEDYKRKNQLYAREILRKYMQKVMSSEQRTLLSLVFDQTTSPIKDAALESLKSNATEAIHGTISSQAEVLLTEHMVDDLVNRHIGQRLGQGLHNMWRGIPFVSQLPPWIRARLLSISMIAINESFYPRITSCEASAHPSTHVQTNRWTEGCHDVYEVNRNVIDFLQRSNDEQLQELKDPRACSFYEKFHTAVLGQPKFSRLTCNGDRNFELVTESKDGDVIEHKVLYWPGTHDIKQIAIRPRHLNPNKKYLKPKTASIIDLTQNGDVMNMANSEIIQATVMPLRLYIMDAHGCCNAQDSGYKAACMAAYNP
jgi:hypothetical protein